MFLVVEFFLLACKFGTERQGLSKEPKRREKQTTDEMGIMKGGGGKGMGGIKTRMKWIGLVGLFLSVFSLFTHFLLARYTDYGGYSESDYHFQQHQQQASITVFSWRPVFENSDLPRNSPLYRRLWGPVPQFGSLHPLATPRVPYAAAAPSLQSMGFIFVRIHGGFHEIRTAIADAVVVARLLNATLVIPEILSTTSTKGISSEFKSFAYLYNEDQFMIALSKDINIVKTLPKNLKEARKKKMIPKYKVANSASPHFYLHHVLPMLKKHSVVELVVSDGGCLQAILPPHLEVYQRLRCRVAYHALRFRQEVQDLATRILNRLRAAGHPFIAFEPGLTREALAYYGCAELFQDVHTELIQHKRHWMIKRGVVKGKLSVNSAEQRLNGSCPLMPEELGIILLAYGYPSDSVIYISGGEVFGGQRILIPLHAMFDNVVDRTSLTTNHELVKLYGRETDHIFPPRGPVLSDVSGNVKSAKSWKNAGPRPRPLPPPPARPKTYNVEGWWGWVAESDREPDSTLIELRTNAHKLLWEAIDYIVCIEADVFIPGFDLDGKGRPNFASLVMGHRVYQSPEAVTYRPDRKKIVKFIDEIRDSIHRANQTWLSAVRKHLRTSLVDGLTETARNSKPLSFLSHPVPECSCWRDDHTSKERTKTRVGTRTLGPSSNHSDLQTALGVLQSCPSWMDRDKASVKLREKENEDDVDDDVNAGSAGVLFRSAGGGNGGISGETNTSTSNKEENQMDDQEEPEGGDR